MFLQQVRCHQAKVDFDYYKNTNKKKSCLSRFLLFFYITIFLVTGIFITNVMAADGLQWDRVRLKADVAIAGVYSDNIYLAEEDTVDDFITEISSELELDMALTTWAWLGLEYLGEYNIYSEADNFKTYNHFWDAFLKLRSYRKSFFTIGAGLDDSAKQPYSALQESRDYLLYRAYCEFDWKINRIFSFGGGYNYSERSLKKELYELSDYTKHDYTLSTVYSRSEILPFLLEYFGGQEEYRSRLNHEPKLNYHSLLAGFRWRPKRRLSGTLGFGYLWTKYTDKDAYGRAMYRSLYSWATRADLIYKIGTLTDFKVTGARGVRISDLIDRDTMDFYIYSRLGCVFAYRRLDPIFVTLEGDYQDRDYRLITSDKTERNDDRYRISLIVEYRLMKSLKIFADYSYLENISTFDALEYRENLIKLGLNFSI